MADARQAEANPLPHAWGECRSLMETLDDAADPTENPATAPCSGAACPAHVMAKVYRLADRVAERARKERVARGPAAESMWAAIQELDSVIQWCDGVSAPQPAA